MKGKYIVQKKEKEIHIVCRVRCKDGSQEQVKEYLNEMAYISRKEPGCLYYDIFQEKDDSTLFYFLDGWKNQNAVNEHIKNPELSDLSKKLMPLYTEGPSLIYGNRISDNDYLDSI